jgi:hypothetical protein
MKSFLEKIKECLNQSCDFNMLEKLLESEKIHLYYDNIWTHIFPENGLTILMMAAKSGVINIVRGILQRDPSCVNIKSSRGFSALHYSAFNGQYGITQFIASRGGDMFARNMYRETAYESALCAGHPQLFQDMLSSFLFPLTLPSEMMGSPVSNMEVVHRQHMIMWSFPIQPTGIPTNEWTADFKSLSYLFRAPGFISTMPSSYVASGKGTPIGSTGAGGGDSTPRVSDSMKSAAGLSQYLLKVIHVADGGQQTLVNKTYDCFVKDGKRECVISIGRRSANTISLSDMSVSNHHAHLVVVEGLGVFLRDVGSKHGTFVDDQRLRPTSTLPSAGEGAEIKSAACVLRIRTDRSVIRIGRISLSFVRKVTPDQPLVVSRR